MVACRGSTVASPARTPPRPRSTTTIGCCRSRSWWSANPCGARRPVAALAVQAGLQFARLLRMNKATARVAGYVARYALTED